MQSFLNMDVLKFSRASVKNLLVFGPSLAKNFYTQMTIIFLVEIRQFLELAVIVNTKVTPYLVLTKSSYTTIKIFSQK